MNPEDFELFADILKRRSGLELQNDKVYLLESRLMPLARKRGIPDLVGLAKEIRENRAEDLLEEITEAMTTNESFFFRDIKPFDLFREHVLPMFLESRISGKRLRIWCAACSTGQEPYSLAMILKEEAAKLNGWHVEILGTDLSSQVLEKAKVGLYSQFEVQRGLPIQYLVKYFTQVGENWQVDSSIRAMVKYRPYNLLHDLKALGHFDIVFCRNVLIYFDQPTKRQVLNRVSEVLARDGVMFMGAAETVMGISDDFRPVKDRRGLYEQVGRGA